jgi:hypothetical protein
MSAGTLERPPPDHCDDCGDPLRRDWIGDLRCPQCDLSDRGGWR